MTIRYAEKEDIPVIAETYIHNHKTTYKNLLPVEYFERLTAQYAEDKWLSYLSDKNNKVWVAEDETGFLGFAASTADEEFSDTWYLDSLHVRENARGKGVGTALIKTVGQNAFINGYRRMSICIVKGNDKAGNLYCKLGAKHYKDFIGKLSFSQKLMWDDVGIFEKQEQ